jgi:hypothetical protein
MNDLRQRIESLSPEKRAALERLLISRRSGVQGTTPIPRRSAGGPGPLSLAQEGLWFFDQWERGNPVYNAALGVSLTGPLDVAALRKTFDSIVERHEILRTTYRVINGSPVQEVQPAGSAGTRFFDARRLSEEKRAHAISRLIRDECRRPFRLDQDLMVRTSLLRASEDEHILLIVAHHIACDGWTRGLLFHEISRWYAFHTTGAPTGLPPVSIQYIDFAAWQREALAGAAMQTQMEYWKRNLSGAPAHIELPLDYPRPALQSYSGAHYSFDLPASVAGALTAFTRQENTTLFISCLAAFNALLHALSGQEDILVGTPIANRGRLELEPLMGFFANTVVMRTRLNGRPDFRTLVRRVKDVGLEAYSNQEVPFGKVVEELVLQRDLSRNPLFQVNFRVRTAAGEELALPGLAVRHLDVDIGTSKFDLALELCASPHGMNGYFEYNTALFKTATVERICSEFVSLAAAVLAQPETPIADLPEFQVIRQHSRSIPASRARAAAGATE